MKSSGVGGGVQAHLQKFWFAENLSKIPENRGINGAQRCLTSKNGTQRLQKSTWRPFLEVTPTKGLHDLCGRKFVGKIAQKTFRAKILRTPKICLLLHQIKNYPWAKFRCESASIGNILENEGLRCGNISGSAAEMLPFRDSALQWQAGMLVCPSSLAHCRKPTLFGTRPYNGRRGYWFAQHLCPIVENQLSRPNVYIVPVVAILR